jgi:serine/threonine protein kinase
MFGGYDGNYVGDLWLLDVIMESHSVTWKRVDSIGGPSARGYHVSAFANECLFIFGGRNEFKVFSDLWIYDISQKSWREVKPSGIHPPPLFGHGFVPISHYLFAIGGCTSNFTMPTDIYAFNLNSNTWYQINGNFNNFEGRLVTNQCISMVDYYSGREKIFVFGGVSFHSKKREELNVFSLESAIKPSDFKTFNGKGEGYTIKTMLSEKVDYNLYLAQTQTRLYALKLIKNFEQFSSKILNIWKLIDHPNIVRLVSTGVHRTTDGDNYGILVTPYYSKGNLTALNKQPEMVLLDLIGQIISAVACVHGQNIPHGNLKLSSVLLSKRDQSQIFLKLTNIGLRTDPSFISMHEFDPNQTFYADLKNLAGIISYLLTRDVKINLKKLQGLTAITDPLGKKRIKMNVYKYSVLYVKWISDLLDPECEIQLLNDQVQHFMERKGPKMSWKDIPGDIHFNFAVNLSHAHVAMKLVKKSMDKDLKKNVLRGSLKSIPPEMNPFENIDTWLSHLQLDQYIPVFHDNKIHTIATMIEMDDTDIEKIRMKPGHRKSFVIHQETLKLKQ